MTDPLMKSGPEVQRELFDRFVRAANGFPAEHAVGAALNLLVNAIRQTYPTRNNAMVALDEKMTTAKALLAEHYDLMGKRRNIFPFTQNIDMPHIDLRKK